MSTHDVGRKEGGGFRKPSYSFIHSSQRHSHPKLLSSSSSFNSLHLPFLDFCYGQSSCIPSGFSSLSHPLELNYCYACLPSLLLWLFSPSTSSRISVSLSSRQKSLITGVQHSTTRIASTSRSHAAARHFSLQPKQRCRRPLYKGTALCSALLRRGLVWRHLPLAVTVPSPA